jgi:hypothetical protein
VSSVLYRLGRFAAQRRRLMLAVWLVVLALACGDALFNEDTVVGTGATRIACMGGHAAERKWRRLGVFHQSRTVGTRRRARPE